jgi:5'-3' exonuclease
MAPPRGPLLAVDAPALLYRAFFALPDSITDPEGRPVNALLGSTNLMLAAVERYAPRAVVTCLGQETATYRARLYPPYHAHRPPMPDALAHQFATAPAFYEALGWSVDVHSNLEADDLLAGLAETETRAGGQTLVLTGDRDLYQLASDQVTVLYLGGGRPAQVARRGFDEVTPREVRRRYGVDPEQVPDFIALRGDPSDGLPGGRGIGEKTARDLLREHGSLEGAIANALRERPRICQALREGAEELRRFREIATVVRVKRRRPPDRPTDWMGGAAAARALGMNQLARRLEAAART